MNTPQSNPSESKTIALISYLTIVGCVIAFVMHGNNKTSLGVFHLRQSAFLMLLAIGLYTIQFFLLFIPHIGWMLSTVFGILGLGLFILWIMGLLSAVNGEEKPLPVVGDKIQQLLGSIS
ncbi:MAG: hypothetical protein WC623_21245 [Pedobacter sp.]|uniref:DUF4870 domain-containing protein n=1 Tax=Pedobacter sp. TaxID=1411316 RepID=UPI003569C5AC